MNVKDNIMFKKGISDCIKGIPTQSNNYDYLRGYGYQYGLEAMLDDSTTQAKSGAYNLSSTSSEKSP